jgi:hypothetical protein
MKNTKKIQLTKAQKTQLMNNLKNAQKEQQRIKEDIEL